MFWRSKVFHPVWMPSEPRQRNYGTWAGPAKAIQVYISTFLQELLQQLGVIQQLWSCVYMVAFIWQQSRVVPSSCLLFLFIPAPLLCWHHLSVGSVVVQLDQFPALDPSSAQDCGAGTGQTAKPAGVGRTRCQQWLMLELMTLQLHPGVFYRISPPLCKSWK